MELIPVIDLMRGQVVHARRGERERYQPLVSTLCQGAEALTVVRALMQVYPFSALYIADLDAIRRQGDNRHILSAVRAAYPQLELWIDAGISDRAAFDALRAHVDCTPVIGSESLNTAHWLDGIAADAAILSLDHRDGVRIGPEQLWRQPQLWPRRVLAMNLSRVGADAGPDLELIRELQTLSVTARIYAAGGVRDVRDLQALRAANAGGALVATALHSGAISREALQSALG